MLRADNKRLLGNRNLGIKNSFDVNCAVEDEMLRSLETELSNPGQVLKPVD